MRGRARLPCSSGYCMGGTLAVAAAQRRPELISVNSLALLAAPWDFHAPDKIRALKRLPGHYRFLEPLMGIGQTMPVDVLQALFAMMDPWSVGDR